MIGGGRRRRDAMRTAQQQQQKQQGGVVRVDQASPASSFRELDDAFLQVGRGAGEMRRVLN